MNDLKMKKDKNIIINEALFSFKLQLQVGLITFKEIQDWADQQLLIDNNDIVILDICFLTNEDEVRDYINDFFRYDVNIDIEKVALKVFKQYFENKMPKLLDSQLNDHILNLKLLADYLFDINYRLGEATLGGYITGYDDDITGAQKGGWSITPQEIYVKLYQYLQNWISRFS